MQLKNTFLRMKFRVRTLFTGKKKTMERLGSIRIRQRIDRIKSKGSDFAFSDKIAKLRKSLGNELLTEGIQ
jgi:hypothetical protein